MRFRAIYFIIAIFILANVILGLFISLVRLLGYFFPKNRTNEMNSPKFALDKWHKPNIWLIRILANANFSQNQKSH